MNKLTAELNAFMNSLMDRIDPKMAKVIDRNYQRLERSGIIERAVSVGDRAPDFTLPDQHNKPFTLQAALAKGPAVVVFVRGGWCPFCTITLRAFDTVRQALEREGASLVAIAPSDAASLEATAERHILRYSLLSDADLAVAASYGLVWEPDAELQAVYAKLGHDLPRLNGTGDWRLPIPAGYVIGTDGIVHAARVDTRLTNRLGPSDALAEVRAMAKAGAA